jgi:DNA invertase Pin-like site-specific DNA recombinase
MRRHCLSSASSAEGREGFARLVAEVGLDHVVLILGVEMSRLAHSSKDWHQLLEICALFGTLIADLDGVYDPSQYNICPVPVWTSSSANGS